MDSDQDIKEQLHIFEEYNKKIDMELKRETEETKEETEETQEETEEVKEETEEVKEVKEETEIREAKEETNLRNRSPQPPRIDVNNINLYLKPFDNYNNSSECAIILSALDLFKILDYRVPKEDLKKAVYHVMITTKGMKFIHENPQFAVVVKAKFHEFIIKDQMINLIPIYNTIFNDNLYDNINIKNVNFELFLSDEEYKKIEKKYNEDIKKMKVVSKYNTPKYTYEIGEIVGAKDKQGNWWLSRIIQSFLYDSHIIYYVEFVGWGKEFNEFISDRFRLEKFNPRKHKYFRPSFRK